ncbi:polyprenyl synthetase family protein [Ligilactobacillus murinus]|uniref:Farnesyl diphosphate synthase n=1 Tax=Ligilactobacillus murinus TaxID=1622 RepID=A0AAD0KXJ9_9LACO|nr:farnesyl diphosphate synthase [Ligilactobacillus murinus]AWZ38146.1 geranyl transferase [Ligilactobacillus murinus]AWZ40867.1 geranyl transferase [Ligilactobacillus murinus]HBV47531.1 polyprenyl synthetase family protein [Lactobacillus sp.]
MQLATFQNKMIPLLEQHMRHYLAQFTENKTLQAAMQYSLEAGGKRIRPLLIMLICQSLEKKIDTDVLSVAGSLEFLHTYSLIHDDLPEMDNDDLRRGKPTNHKVFGQDIAVLAGDALLTEAFGWLAKTKLTPKKRITLVAALAKAAGANGMVAGQTGDILGEKTTLTLSELMQVHKNKTGQLLEYACFAGAILGEATPKQEQALVTFGQKFGLAFQIYDDILDVTSTTAELGKTANKDVAENKNTYPLLLGLKGAKQALVDTLKQAKDQLEFLDKSGLETSLLRQVLEYFKL